MPSDPEPTGQSKTRDLPQHSQHYARPCQAHVPATGPRESGAVSGSLRTSSIFLCGRSSLAPAELGRIHPHAMDDDSQFTCKSDFSALHATPVAPRPQRFKLESGSHASA
jgi:hypothetical protein